MRVGNLVRIFNRGLRGFHRLKIATEDTESTEYKVEKENNPQGKTCGLMSI